MTLLTLDGSTEDLYYGRVGLQTTVFERAEALGWGIPELARRAGLSAETLYKLRSGYRQPGQKTIEGLLQAFPNLTYRDLFSPSDRTDVRRKGMKVRPSEVAA